MDLKAFLDPLVCHRVFFEHRHDAETPRFHVQMQGHMHDVSEAKRFQIWMAFRGGAKSTTAEEVVCIQGGFPALLSRLGVRESPVPLFRNCVILAASEELAVERLAAIKNEFEMNEWMQLVFGDLTGSPWGETKIVLSTGAAIQARGREQGMRGLKHLTWRPDLLLIDDLEDEEVVETPEARRKLKSRFMKVILPALAPKARVLFLATPLHPESLPMVLKEEKGGKWFSRTYPIEMIDPVSGERRALWPDRFPLETIDEMRGMYERQGALLDWEQEYMCRAEVDGERQFQSEYFRREPIVRTFQGVWIMVDPARTTGAKSADTALVAFSWVGVRLIVWKAVIGKFMPDEIVDHIEQMDAEFSPVAIGVEEDGLNQWLLQPLRRKMVEVGRIIPIRAMKAPRNKMEFIRSLQPFFKAGEVTFAGDCQELETQFLGFPRGRIDGPNALAYAPRLRVGPAIYEDFTTENISLATHADRARTIHCALNSDGAVLSCVCAQFRDDGANVLADYIFEGDPAETLGRLLREISLEFGGRLKLICPPGLFRDHSATLPAAAMRVPVDLDGGAMPEQGRAELRRMLKERNRGMPSFTVSSSARWTANGFLGGYARDTQKFGMLSEEPVDNVYAVLMRGLESLVGRLAIEVRDGDDDLGGNFGYTSDGRRYRSALRIG